MISRQEVMTLASQILDGLELRIDNGAVTFHYHEGVLQRIEVGNVFRISKPDGEVGLGASTVSINLDRRGPVRAP